MPSKSPEELRVKREEETCQISAKCCQNVAKEAAFGSGKNSAKKHQFSYDFELKKYLLSPPQTPFLADCFHHEGRGGMHKKRYKKSYFCAVASKGGGVARNEMKNPSFLGTRRKRRKESNDPGS